MPSLVNLLQPVTSNKETQPPPSASGRPSQDSPVLSAIREARDLKLAELSAFVAKIPWQWADIPPSPKQLKQAGEDLLRLAKEWTQLVRLLGGDGPLNTERAIYIGKLMREMGSPEDEVEAVLQRTESGAEGALPHCARADSPVSN